METLQITKDSALKAHNEANDKGKRLLENLFGSRIFKGTIIERISDFEDICKEKGITESEATAGITDKYKCSEKRIEIAAEVLREGKPASECWYYPYFYRNGSGGFSFNDTNNDDTNSNVRARITKTFAAQTLPTVAKNFRKLKRALVSHSA